MYKYYISKNVIYILDIRMNEMEIKQLSYFVKS